MTSKPWGGMDPNSQHQLWSHWTFRVESAKHIPIDQLKPNVMRWLKQGFGTTGQARISDKLMTVYDPVLRLAHVTEIECDIEGKPAHDPDYVASVKRGFDRFVDGGWGVTAIRSVSVDVTAGDKQDGKPREQMVVMPRISLLEN